MRDFELCEEVAKTFLKGSKKDAFNELLKGCKAKPVKFAIRCMDVHSELMGMGQAGVAARFKYYIEEYSE